MFPFDLHSDMIVPLMIFAVPLVAITGGIIMGIVRTLGRQRMVELSQRERIAAIERGVDPSKLQPIDLGRTVAADSWDVLDRPSSPLRRAQGLLIGGLVTLFAGLGITLFLGIIMRGHSGEDASAWAIGLVPVFIGIALLISAKIVWPTSGGPAH